MLRMFESFAKSPLNAFIFGVALGGIFVALLKSNPGDVLEWTAIVGNIVLGAMFSLFYYFSLRSIVQNTKLKEELRTIFAPLFFVAIGIFLGIGAFSVARGIMSVLEAVVTFFVYGIFLTIAYRKIFKLYRAAGASGGAEPPKSQ